MIDLHRYWSSPFGKALCTNTMINEKCVIKPWDYFHVIVLLNT